MESTVYLIERLSHCFERNQSNGLFKKFSDIFDQSAYRLGVEGSDEGFYFIPR